MLRACISLCVLSSVESVYADKMVAQYTVCISIQVHDDIRNSGSARWNTTAPRRHEHFRRHYDDAQYVLAESRVITEAHRHPRHGRRGRQDGHDSRGRWNHVVCRRNRHKREQVSVG